VTVRQSHPIEVRSYEILRSRIDLSLMLPLSNASGKGGSAVAAAAGNALLYHEAAS